MNVVNMTMTTKLHITHNNFNILLVSNVLPRIFHMSSGFNQDLGGGGGGGRGDVCGTKI